MAAKRIYPTSYFETIKETVIVFIKSGMTVKKMAYLLDINRNTLASMMMKAGVSAVRIRYDYNKGVTHEH